MRDYVRFTEFLKAPRGLTLTDHARNDISPSTCLNLAHRFRWLARKRARENHIRQIQLHAEERASKAVIEDHAALWGDVLALAHERILKARVDGEEISIRDAIALAKLATDGQRLLAGEATSRVDVRDATMRKASTEALEEALALLDDPEDSEPLPH